MKTKLFAANFIPILAQTTGDLAGGASKALGIVMLIGFIFGTICVVGGGFAIRRGDTDAGRRAEGRRVAFRGRSSGTLPPPVER